METNDDIRDKLERDAARSLNVSMKELPGDLSDMQLDRVLALAHGTTAVKRCRGDFPIPSYKIGRARRTPLSAVIDFKLNQLEAADLAA